MNRQTWKIIVAGLLAILIVSIPTAALLRADSSARPMMSHDFTDVPVAGQEFMEPYINAFYHLGITGGCSASPLQYCPTNPVTRGSMAVFMGRALGYVDAVAVGYDTRAYFKHTGPGILDYGVIGEAPNGTGVLGISPMGVGIEGRSSSYAGVYGYSDNGLGVFGRSVNSYGVYAMSTGLVSALFADSDSDGTDILNDDVRDIDLGGNFGELYAGGGTLALASTNNLWIDLDDDNNSTTSEVAIFNGTDTMVFTLNELGNLFVSGNTFAAGSKSAIVDTVHYGTRAMYAIEGTEVWFEDAGSAQLIDGVAVVAFDEIFVETVNLDEEYHVFLTPIGGWADLYIEQRSATSFTVRSADGSDVEFSYRIMAKRLGYEDVRLEQIDASGAAQIDVNREEDTD